MTDKGDRITLEGVKTTKCNNCQQEITFLVSKRTGKKYPVDVDYEFGEAVCYRAGFHSKTCASPREVEF